MPEDPAKARDSKPGDRSAAETNASLPGDSEAVTEVVSPGSDAVTEVVNQAADAVTEVVPGEQAAAVGPEGHWYPPPSPEWLLLSGPQPPSPPVFEPPAVTAPGGATGSNRSARKLRTLVLGLVAVVLVATTATVSIWLTSDRTAAQAKADPSPTSRPLALQGAVVATPSATAHAKPRRSSTGAGAPTPTNRSSALAVSSPSAAASKRTGGVTNAASAKICARGHVENAGWQPWACAAHGQRLTVGTVGQSLRLEAIEVYTVGTGGICLNAHEQDTGWQGQTCQVDGAIATAGTTAQSRRMEALQIQTGSGVCARGQVQNVGWQAQTCVGPNAWVQVGTTGQSLRLEAIELSV